MEIKLNSNGGGAGGVGVVGGVAAVQNGGGEELEALKKDVDFVMGRSGAETGEISGIPSLVSNYP